MANNQKDIIVAQLKVGRVIFAFMAAALGYIAFNISPPDTRQQKILRETFAKEAIGLQVVNQAEKIENPLAFPATVDLTKAQSDAQKRLDYTMQQAESSARTSQIIFGAAAGLMAYNCWRRHKQLKEIEATPN